MTAPQDPSLAAQGGLLRRAAPWLASLALLGVALSVYYPDSYQQDGGFHFLFARWAVKYPKLLVDVWGRPLFTLLYALPSQLGYPAAKLVTVAVCLAAGWHTARLAEAYGLRRAELAIPLLYLQPTFLLVSSELMTEPLFALVLVIALRLRRAGRVGAALWVAGLLPLARPEGFFVGVLWGAFTLADARAGATLLRRALATLRLLGGCVAWWLAALLLTGNPFFIRDNWPPNWGAFDNYGTGPFWHYLTKLHEIVSGPAALALLVVGLVVLVRARRAGLALSALALIVGLHTVMFHYGLFGSAGYARYLVCVAPPMALAMLAGWNAFADRLRGAPRWVAPVVAALTIALSVLHSVVFVDSWVTARDARGIREMYAWFQAHPRPVKKLVFSHAYVSILFGRDPRERPRLGEDPEKNVELLRALPPGTLIFWDNHTGPQFHKIGGPDLARTGFELLRRQEYDLQPLLPISIPQLRHRRLELYLYYKP